MSKTLPGMKMPPTNSQLATKYINELYTKDMYKLHKNYFKNYLALGYGPILSHIRKAYLKFVCTDKWSLDKFETILYVLISNEQIISNQALENMSAEYDNGSIKLLEGYADIKNGNLKHDTSEDMSDEDLIKFLKGI